LEGACERHSPLACLYWADLQQHTEGARLELSRIRIAYAVACDGLRDVSPVACVRSAMLDADAARDATAAAKPIDFLTMACERRSSSEACSYLGEAYRTGKVVAPDKNRAAELLRRACDLGHKESCGELP
jgi:TPR repeat protein